MDKSSTPESSTVSKRVIGQLERCQSCIDYEMQLQTANAEIAELERQLCRLELAMTIKNETIDTQIQSKTNENPNHPRPSYECHETEHLDPLMETIKVEPMLNDDSVVSPAFSLGNESPIASVSGPLNGVIKKRYNELLETSNSVEIVEIPFEPEQSMLKRNASLVFLCYSPRVTLPKLLKDFLYIFSVPMWRM